jgi:hypothetical protein
VIAMGVTFDLLSRKTKVTPDNVNDEWTGQVGIPAAQFVAA